MKQSGGSICGEAREQKIGRPVRVVSIGFSDLSLEEMLAVVDAESSKGADIIVLPEMCQGEGLETLDGPTIPAIARLAAKHRTYVICPVCRQEEGRRLNSAVLLDRNGNVVCIYDKVFPYWSEFDLNPPAQPGLEVPVYEADFGRIGMAICFDVNFPEVWQRLADQDAELVLWSSAYAAGTSLQAYALLHHFYIVTATLERDCIVYDITGEQILHERIDPINITRLTLDLDRGIYHTNFNIDKRDKLLAEHSTDVVQEKLLRCEQWFVLKARRPGVRARELAREYGLEELRDYIRRSRREINRRRGWRFGFDTV